MRLRFGGRRARETAPRVEETLPEEKPHSGVGVNNDDEN